MSPFSLVRPWVLDIWHVLGAEQEEPMFLLIQQGLQVPACIVGDTPLPCFYLQNQYWLLDLVTQELVIPSTWKA